MRYKILALTLMGLMILVPAHAKRKKRQCSLLVLEVKNATASVARLQSDPDHHRTHGYIAFPGESQLIPGASTRWQLRQHPFSGPEGIIEYQFKDPDHKKHLCTIHYDQSYCGLFMAGNNSSYVIGDCTIYNDPMRPSLRWDWSGHSQVVLINP